MPAEAWTSVEKAVMSGHRTLMATTLALALDTFYLAGR
jgi:hypothetical protein